MKKIMNHKTVSWLLPDKKHLRNGSYSLILTVIVISCAVLLNLLVSELPASRTQFDFSDQKLYTLSSQTKEMASGLTENITLYYMVQENSRDETVARLLEQYDGLSPHISVIEKDPVLYPNFASQYTSEVLTDNSIIAVCGNSSQVVHYEDMYEMEFNYEYYTYETTGFDGEGQITRALAAVISDDLPVLYTLTGHREPELDDTAIHSIEKNNIQIKSLNLVTSEQIPDDADCLLIYAPAADLSEAEADKILSYLRTGGTSVIITDYTTEEMPQLDSILSWYGIQRTDGIVLEGSSSYYVQTPYYLIPAMQNTELTENLLTGGSSYVLLTAAQGLRTSGELRDGLTVTPLLSTSDSAYAKKNVQNMVTYLKEDGDEDGPFDLAVMITETVEPEQEENNDSAAAPQTAETKLAIFTSSSLLDASADQMVSGGNMALFLNTLSWMCGREMNVSVPVKSLSIEYLTVTSSAGSIWGIVVIGIIPGFFLITGLAIWLRRRRQ